MIADISLTGTPGAGRITVYFSKTITLGIKNYSSMIFSISSFWNYLMHTISVYYRHFQLKRTPDE